MKRGLLTSFLLITSVTIVVAQNVGIGTVPDSSAALHVDKPGKGILLPRMTTSGVMTMVRPARGLMAHDTLLNQIMINNGTKQSPSWKSLTADSWSINGNSNYNPSTQYLGSKDNQPLRFRVNNVPAGELNPSNGNIFWGMNAGNANTTGYSNIAIGKDALKLNTVRSNIVAIGDSSLMNNGLGGSLSSDGSFNTGVGSKTLYKNDLGSFNTGLGSFALFANTYGYRNTGVGAFALYSNTAGYGNTATGTEALIFNLTGYYNTASGHRTLFSNGAGSANSAFGAMALYLNINGHNNTASGYRALASSIEGSNNTALGYEALASSVTASGNTAVGYQALVSNTTGNSNAAVGIQAMRSNTTGHGNSALGLQAMHGNIEGSYNTAIGHGSLPINTVGGSNTAIGSHTLFASTYASNNTAVGSLAARWYNMGYNNTIIGANADVNQNNIYNAVAIGESAVCTGSNQVRLGNISTGSIGGVVGFSNVSDGRFKKNIRNEVKGLEFIMKLRPVTYQLDFPAIEQKLRPHQSNNDSARNRSINENEGMSFSGFVAQEVERAASETGYSFSGLDKPKNENDLYGLRYAEFVVPLVKALQEQQQQIENLQKQLKTRSDSGNDSKQQQVISDLKKQNEELKRANNSQRVLFELLMKRIEKLEFSIHSKYLTADKDAAGGSSQL